MIGKSLPETLHVSTLDASYIEDQFDTKPNPKNDLEEKFPKCPESGLLPYMHIRYIKYVLYI